MPRPTEISRREAVRRMSVLVGGALSSSTVAALLGGCGGTRDRDPAAWAPRVLTAEQLDRLEVLVDTILPPTDTPGASEAGVPAFV
ncbi:MAG: gluconate 2-dehydrogenase subunit 3 family protein, partial [Longimicrobiales bacterium]|nr:gluconate 2-dehydrogenase subunit 3 family protein [Longimicrobiales bacterium]